MSRRIRYLYPVHRFAPRTRHEFLKLAITMLSPLVFALFVWAAWLGWSNLPSGLDDRPCIETEVRQTQGMPFFGLPNRDETVCVRRAGKNDR